MSDLTQILKEEYFKQMHSVDMDLLIEMIEEVMDSVEPIVREEVAAAPKMDNRDDEATLRMLLRMIPDIEVSEIGWSDVRTRDEDVEIKGPQRQLLENYLSNIKGDDFAARIASVSSFYENGAGLIAEQAGDDRTQRIVQAISYLVFYKTLTKVVTNFNASSAGFSFESFLAALVDGYQIPANKGTIADYVDRASGKEIPVSLKLYRKGGLEVGGSYTDLVNDLVKPQFSSFPGMRYVVCTKNLEGKGLEQEGSIQFYQFDFTLENVMNILLASKYPYVIRVHQASMSAIEAGQQVGTAELLDLPEAGRELSAEELTPLFKQALQRRIQGFQDDNPEHPLAAFDNQALDALIEELNWEKNDDIFNKDKIRGKGALGKKQVRNWVKAAYAEAVEDYLPLVELIIGANADVVAQQSAASKKSERNKMIDAMIDAGEFLSPEETARRYSTLGVSQRRQALLSSLGYLRRLHFALNETQSTNPGEPTNTIDIGQINIGRQMVANVLNSVRDLLNGEVYQIFESLKLLSDSLNTFFAGGLEDDSQAAAAVQNANNISSSEILSDDEAMLSWATGGMYESKNKSNK